MRYALSKPDQNADRIEAAKGLDGYCPGCLEQLIPKCGRVVVHHWAHKSLRDCDPWWEPMSRWHVEWQDRVVADSREVYIRHADQCHRADIVGNNGRVVEVQKSSISVEEVRARNDFYAEATGQRPAWIFWVGDIDRDRLWWWKPDSALSRLYVRFRWKRARLACVSTWEEADVFWDFGDGDIVLVRKCEPHHKSGWSGWGQLLTPKQVTLQLMAANLKWSQRTLL